MWKNDSKKLILLGYYYYYTMYYYYYYTIIVLYYTITPGMKIEVNFWPGHVSTHPYMQWIHWILL